jgi:hypothetical protein
MKRPHSSSAENAPPVPSRLPARHGGWLKPVKRRPFRYVPALEELEGRCLLAWAPDGPVPQLFSQTDSGGVANQSVAGRVTALAVDQLPGSNNQV